MFHIYLVWRGKLTQRWSHRSSIQPNIRRDEFIPRFYPSNQTSHGMNSSLTSGMTPSHLHWRSTKRTLNHQVECLVVVDPRPLGKAPTNPTSLVTLQWTFNMELVLEYPLAHHDIRARRVRYRVPGVVGDQGGVLLHSAPINKVDESTTCGWGFRGERQWSESS
jgi:hypothetical protein